MMKDKNFISAVIYLDGRLEKCVHFIKEIDKVFYDFFESYEIICVSDGRDPETSKVIKELSLSPNCGNYVLIDMGGVKEEKKLLSLAWIIP